MSRYAPPHKGIRTRMAASIVAGAFVLVGTIGYHPADTLAVWTEAENVSGAMASATLPNIPGALGCTTTTPLVLPSSVLVTWTAPTLPAGAQYEVRVTKGATSASTYQTGSSMNFTVSLLDDTFGFLTGSSGPSTVQVRTVFLGSTGTPVWWSSAYTARTIQFTAPVLFVRGGFECDQ